MGGKIINTALLIPAGASILRGPQFYKGRLNLPKGGGGGQFNGGPEQFFVIFRAR